MQELLDRLTGQAGLSNEQAVQAVTIIKDYAKEKFPLFAGAIEQMFKKYSPKEEDDFLE